MMPRTMRMKWIIISMTTDHQRCEHSIGEIAQLKVEDEQFEQKSNHAEANQGHPWNSPLGCNAVIPNDKVDKQHGDRDEL